MGTSKVIPQIVKQIQNRSVPVVDYNSQRSISYSQFTKYNECPHKWALIYKDGNKPFNSSINTVFGTSIHETIQHYITVMYNESIIAADRINLEEYFEIKFREEYLKQYKSNKKSHFSNPEEMNEFFEDGKAILEFLKRKKSKYFAKKGWWLVGCEIPILVTPNNNFPNLLFQGYLDLVLYNETSNTFKIIDIKTSKSTWNNVQKSDEIKQFQLILYKQYFAHQFQVPIENIDIAFLVVKRKVWEGGDFPISRIQEFVPSSGKIKVSRALNSIDNFIKECFNSNGIIDREHPPEPSLHNCRFCPFSNNKELCSAGIN